MITKIVEATNEKDGKHFNWGKFLVGRFDKAEWARQSLQDNLDPRPLLRMRGWDVHHVLVLDLETGEGAIFSPGGSATHDLNKHRVWVCPLFEPFLTWLYTQDLTDINALPDCINLPDAERAMWGHRRNG